MYDNLSLSGILKEGASQGGCRSRESENNRAHSWLWGKDLVWEGPIQVRKESTGELSCQLGRHASVQAPSIVR